MSTASKLWLGFGFLLLFLIGIGTFVSFRLTTIEQALTTIMAVQEPATATAYEMALNVSATNAAVLAHLGTREPAHRLRVAGNQASFNHLLDRYNQIARSPASRKLGLEIRTAHDELNGLGDSLMTMSDQAIAGGRLYERRAETLRRALAGLDGHVDARGRDAQHKFAEIARMQAGLSGISAAVGSYLNLRSAMRREQLTTFVEEYRRTLGRYAETRYEEAERLDLQRLHTDFPPVLEAAREAMDRADRVETTRSRFAALGGRLERLVDDGIHSLARTDLVEAQTMAKRDIHVSILAVLALLVAGVMIGGMTALPVGRSILRSEQDLRDRMRELADAHARKDEFLGVLGHELRNPLSPLNTSLEVLEARGSQLPPDVRELHQRMKRQVTSLKRLVSDLLDLSRIGQGRIPLRREPVRVGQLVAQTVEDLRPLAEAQQQTLRLNAAGEALWVDGDPVRLSQMVTNLLNNAIKYTPTGGRIELAARADKGHIVIRVGDDGLGIPADQLEQIFEPFTQVDPTLTRSQGGLGIGLSLVRSLAHLHGGTVTAESAGPGQGSTFTLRLPRIDTPRNLAASKSAAPGHKAAARAAPWRILVVDDNRDAAESMGDLLRLWGHDVNLAFDGREALRRASEFRPEMVLLDIGLPGMDGYQVADRLRKEGTSGMTLIALTGFGQPEDRDRAFAAGFDHHLTKPVDHVALQTLLGRRTS